MARSIWTGSISFGLVNVPVKAYTAVRDHDVHFHQIDKDTGARIRNVKVSEESGDEVDSDDILMGFEVRRGRYVTFAKDELKELRPASTWTIDITDFVALEDVDPIYYERTYWLGPHGEPAKKPYGLLLAAMEDRQRVAIGTVVMRNKQYLAAIRPLEGALAMSTMRFADEVVPRSQVDGVPDRRTKPEPRALAMATQLVESLSADWKPSKYADTYTEQLRERIKARSTAGGKQREEGEPAPDSSPKVVDLMAALEASVKASKAGRAAKPSGSRASKSAQASESAQARRVAAPPRAAARKRTAKSA